MDQRTEAQSPAQDTLILGPFDRGVAHFDESDLFFRHLATAHPTGGMLVDVGAHHGGSVRQFCRAGWVVHAFEPDPANRKKLEEAVEPAWSLTINEEAVAETDGDTVDFFASPESTGVSGLSPFLSSHERVAQVETVRLSTYLARETIDHVDYLKIDTEGHDLFVLKSFPWDLDMPDAIECEFEDNKTLALGYSSEDLAQFLIAKGYRVLVSEWHPIVRYGISHDFRTLRHYEEGSIAGTSWGNFMAVRTDEAVASLVEHANRRGADMREPATPPPVDRGVSSYPADHPHSPSAVPLIAGEAERATAHEDRAKQLAATPAPKTEPSAPAPSGANRSMRASITKVAKRLIRYYSAPTGLLLAAALALTAVGLVGFDYAWVAGVAGIALLAVFLPFKFSRFDERLVAQTYEASQEAKAAGQAAKHAQSAADALLEDVDVSVQRLDARIDQLNQLRSEGDLMDIGESEMFGACPVCDSAFTAFVRMVPTRRTKIEVALHTCLDCKSFWNPGSYEEDDAQLERDVAWGLGVADRNIAAGQNLFEILASKGVTPKSVVDVGCGIGTLLSVAAGRGIDAIGFDVNSRAIEAGRETYSLDLRAEPWTKETECGNPDLILSISVLQHIALPRPLFAEMCAGAKASHGSLFVSVPMVARSNWDRILNPDPAVSGTWLSDNDVHITHFSPQGLRGLFEEHGATEIVAIDEGLWRGFLASFH